jgi:soluble lytic murein transglycosylase
MTAARLSLAVVTLLGVIGAANAPTSTRWIDVRAGSAADEGRSEGARSGGFRAVYDSALSELEAGRYWHATRLLREAGAAYGMPTEVLTLARAEAGWENWPAVAELLEGVEWLEQLEDGSGLYLLAHAHEAAGRWDSAAEGYGRYSDFAGADRGEGVAALARRARALWQAGEVEASLAALAALGPSPVLRSWTAVELALAAAEAGDAEGVRRLSAHAIEPRAVAALWRAEADALLEAGDSVAAGRAFEALLDGTAGGRRAVASVELGRLRLAAGDSVGARELLIAGLQGARGGTRTRAAQALYDLGGHDYTRTLQLARLLDRAGDGARALRGYDHARALAESAGEVFPESSRVERARLMSTVRERMSEALEEFRAIRETTGSERVGARNLEVWAQMRARQGRRDAVQSLRGWLLEDYPASSEAAELAWTRGTNAEAGGRFGQALGHYRFLTENVPTDARAGQARMRTGQIHLRRADPEAAAEVFEQYLTDFPEGRRWQEAAYWAGRTRLQLGDTAAARAHLMRVLRQPIEYYAVMAAELLEVPYRVDLPEGPSPSEPGWLTEGLTRLDLLTEAGLGRGAGAEIDRLRERAEGTTPVMLRLAGALIERGRTIDGINIGWSVLEAEGQWSRQVLRVTYPFPYRELVRREAAEWGIDPIMLAAIIRQESAFSADIVSRAGAIGLMQVMPPTGAQLARAHGPDGFTNEALTKPEVNLHLGAAFFVDMSVRYDYDLPLVLSAYNAGPSRATRWRRYPEAADPLRFTERIPFVETRGYVKSVRRNLGVYRALYGQD